MHRFIALVAALVCAAGLAVAGPAAPAGAAARPTVSDAQVVAAPIGEKGGILTPYVACGNWRVQPRVRTVITGLTNDYRKVYTYRGSMPGYGFPRVAVGDYRIKTVARCRGTRGQRVEDVTVTEKTTQRTMSRAEYRSIERGMTTDRVRNIVGYGGAYGGAYRGRTSRTYDAMPFWSIAMVEYRHGRVVGKEWNIGHD